MDYLSGQSSQGDQATLPAQVNSIQAERTQAGHIPSLDGIRGLAVFMVLILHFDPQVGGPAALSRAVSAVAHLGQLGVDIFFVLSGFLITGILLRTKREKGYLKNFYMRRALRIFPLYYGTLLVLLIANLIYVRESGIERLWWFATYLQNIPMTFRSGGLVGPAHFWSLAVEEHFYFVWPMLVYLVPRRQLPRVLMLIIVFAFVSRAILLYFGFGVYYFTPCRIDSLALGSLLAIMSEEKAMPSLRLVCGLILAGIPLVIASFLLVSGKSLVIVQMVRFPMIGVLCSMVLILSQVWQPATAFFSTLLLRFFGKYSYALYVFHPFTVILFHRQALRGAVGFLIFLCLNCVLALLSWHLWEKHFLRLKRRFESARKSVIKRKVSPEPGLTAQVNEAVS